MSHWPQMRMPRGQSHRRGTRSTARLLGARKSAQVSGLFRSLMLSLTVQDASTHDCSSPVMTGSEQRQVVLVAEQACSGRQPLKLVHNDRPSQDRGKKGWHQAQ